MVSDTKPLCRDDKGLSYVMRNKLISSALEEFMRCWIPRVPPVLRDHGVFALVAQQSHLEPSPCVAQDHRL